jgi:WD40 repeat protein
MVWGPDGKLYSASCDRTIRVWSDDGTTIVKTTEFMINGLAWADGNLFATALARQIWMWSSDQLGPTDPLSQVLDGAVCGSSHLVSGSSGDLYALAGKVIVKM